MMELIFGVPARVDLGLKMAGNLALIFCGKYNIPYWAQFIMKRSIGRGSVCSNVNALYLLN